MRAIIDTDYIDISDRFHDAKVEPLCGWPWLAQNRRKRYPEQTITILYDGKAIFTLTSKDKKKSVKAVMQVASSHSNENR